MLHEVFQEAMKANRWDTDWLKNTIDAIVAKHIEDLYAIKLSIPQAVEHMRSKMPELQAWAGVFVKARPDVSSFSLQVDSSLVLTHTRPSPLSKTVTEKRS